jgi:hypothetical protein
MLSWIVIAVLGKLIEKALMQIIFVDIMMKKI